MGKSAGGSGKILDFYLPGMITIDGKSGLYPAISITGKRCQLGCLHCRGSLLKSMIHCEDPDELPGVLKKLERQGFIGALITGGCDKDGSLPLLPFLERISGLKTNLYLTCHSGLNVDKNLAKTIKDSGIKQALIDVVGDDETLSKIFHLEDISMIGRSLDNLYKYGPTVVPHVLIGLNHGKIKGEYEALRMINYFSNRRVVIVVLMPNVLNVEPPPIEEVVEIFRFANRVFQEVSLGCARPRGRYRRELEKRLIEENLIDRMAIWSDIAIETARRNGYKLNFHYTCCSVDDYGNKGD